MSHFSIANTLLNPSHVPEVNKLASETALKMMELSSIPLPYEEAFARAKKALLSNEEQREPKESCVPAVEISQSIQHDYLVCLEDGAEVKMLKPYLKRFGMTPADYREKWALPNDYPMVCPEYAGRRSILAKASGLGKSKG